MLDGQPAFIPHHTAVTAPGAQPARWMAILHGIYGRGDNWRTFARRLVERRPDWGAVLVDLRLHGRSTDAPGPHSVDAAARDVRALARQLEQQGRPVRAVFGHSFGGKVALGYRGQALPGLAHTWVVDASPSARPEAMRDPDNTVVRVLEMLGRMPGSFAERAEFVAAVRDHGLGDALAHWLAMNLERRGDRYVSRLDADGVGALLADYYQIDAWPVVEAAGPGALGVIVAGRSSAVSAGDRARLSGLAAAGADVELTVIDEAGHWVHIDALEPLVAAVAGRLSAS